MEPNRHLLEALLASMPQREHDNEEWKIAGLKEYFYTSRAMTEKSEQRSKSVALHMTGKVSADQAVHLVDEIDAAGSSSAQLKSIQDGQVKAEPGEITVASWENIKKDIKRHGIICNALSTQALAALGSLEQMVDAKPFLKALHQEFRKQIEVFTPFCQRVQTFAGRSFCDAPDVAQCNEMETLLNQARAHIAGLKGGAFKEVKAIVA